MKANEAPEKIYIPQKIYLPYKDGKVIGLVKETGVPYKSGVDGNIEYTRTDAFIEEAWSWIEDNLLTPNQQDNCELYRKQFVKAMKL